MPQARMWHWDDGVDCTRRLSAHLAPIKVEVGLAGGVLKRGFSDHDLDIILFPTRKNIKVSLPTIHDHLQSFGLDLLKTSCQVKEKWRMKFGGSSDTKHVEIWIDPTGRQIDFFYLDLL